MVRSVEEFLTKVKVDVTVMTAVMGSLGGSLGSDFEDFAMITDAELEENLGKVQVSTAQLSPLQKAVVRKVLKAARAHLNPPKAEVVAAPPAKASASDISVPPKVDPDE